MSIIDMKKGDKLIYNGINYTVFEVGSLSNGSYRRYVKAISDCGKLELSQTS